MLGRREVSTAIKFPNPKASLTPLRAPRRFARQPQQRSAIEEPELSSSVAARELSREVLDRLARNSITTVEEVLGLAREDQRFGAAFLTRLGIPRKAVDSLRYEYLRTAAGRDELTDRDRFEGYSYALGFDWRDTAEPDTADQELGTAAAGPMPDVAVNLATTCTLPIRDQQDRDTCTAFASVACLEHHFCRTTGSTERLSEQFQYWNMVEQTGRHTLAGCFPMLKTDGVCRATTWPYHGKEIPGNDGQGPPPPNAVADAAARRCGEILRLPARSFPALQKALRDGRMVAVGFPVYRSWLDNPVVRKYGNITLPIPGEVPEELGHAVALVGFADDAEFAGSGYFIVRNSWNHVWGTSSVFGSGYGTIPYAYIQRLNWDAWCITR